MFHRVWRAYITLCRQHVDIHRKGVGMGRQRELIGDKWHGCRCRIQHTLLDRDGEWEVDRDIHKGMGAVQTQKMGVRYPRTKEIGTCIRRDNRGEGVIQQVGLKARSHRGEDEPIVRDGRVLRGSGSAGRGGSVMVME